MTDIQRIERIEKAIGMELSLLSQEDAQRSKEDLELFYRHAPAALLNSLCDLITSEHYTADSVEKTWSTLKTVGDGLVADLMRRRLDNA